MNNEIKTTFLFEKVNYKILLIGLGIIALGFILMAGGGSDDPNVFSEDIFSWRRIRLAPTVVLIGFGVTIYAILKNPGAPVAELREDTKAGTPPTVSDRLVEEQPIKNFTNKKKK
jgi:hypothetical protein